MTDEQNARGATRSLTGHARRVALLTLLAVAALAIAAGGAQAVIVTIGKTRVSYEPLRNATRQAGVQPSTRTAVKPLSKKNVTYHGGPVMPSNTNYAIYWDPSGGAAYPAGYTAGINRYFEDVAHDSGGLLNTDSVLAQYGDSGGEFAKYDSHFGGGLIDTDPYPANGCTAAPKCLTDAQIRAEITSFVQAHSLPTDLQHEYFVLTPKGVESCMEAEGKVCSAGIHPATYCAYHRYINLPKGAVLVYADNPYVAGLGCGDKSNTPNGNPSDETIAGGLAHEHSESVTDPELSAWYDSSGNEVGDKCRVSSPEVEFGPPLGTAPNGSNYNQVINGDLYWYQQEWSNEAGACEQRQLQVPTIKKLKPKSGPLGGKTSVTITGTGFTAGATVSFGEVAAEEVIFESPTSIIAVSPAGASPGPVDVRVTTAGGTSAITKKDHFKYKSH